MKMEEKNRPALLVLNDPWAMRINHELAQEIGFENSIVLLQIEFLIRRASSTNFKENLWWTYQTLKQLKTNFPWWSEKTISRIVADLQKRKLIFIGNFNKSKMDRTQWFALNEEGINKLKTIKLADKSFVDDICQSDKCIPQSDKCIIPKRQMHADKLTNACGQIDTTIPKIFSENITKKKIEEREEEREEEISHSLNTPPPFSPTTISSPQKREAPKPTIPKTQPKPKTQEPLNQQNLENDPLLQEFASLLRLNMQLYEGGWSRLAWQIKAFSSVGINSEQVKKFGLYWCNADWRGKKGEKPTLKLIVELWETAMAWIDPDTIQTEQISTSLVISHPQHAVAPIPQHQQPKLINNKAIQTQSMLDRQFDAIEKQMKG